jgi:predicted RNA binding protein YcfA (HicA-like mRNA interferase family)
MTSRRGDVQRRLERAAEEKDLRRLVLAAEAKTDGEVVVRPVVDVPHGHPARRLSRRSLPRGLSLTPVSGAAIRAPRSPVARAVLATYDTPTVGLPIANALFAPEPRLTASESTAIAKGTWRSTRRLGESVRLPKGMMGSTEPRLRGSSRTVMPPARFVAGARRRHLRAHVRRALRRGRRRSPRAPRDRRQGGARAVGRDARRRAGAVREGRGRPLGGWRAGLARLWSASREPCPAYLLSPITAVSIDRYRGRYHAEVVTKREKLFDAVRNNPRDVRFVDLVRLVEGVGFVRVRQSGSHAVFQHPEHPTELIDLQPGSSGKAKPYQVRQVLDVLDRCKLEVT